MLAGLAIVRPALAFAEHNPIHSLLLIVCDYSGSMTIQDESNHLSRWELLLQTLRESGPELDRLREEQQMDVRFFKFAGEVVEFQPNDPGAADGKRTDTGAMLRALFDQRDGQQPLRSLLLLSDGADNGSARTPALARGRSLAQPALSHSRFRLRQSHHGRPTKRCRHHVHRHRAGPGAHQGQADRQAGPRRAWLREQHRSHPSVSR